MNVVQPQRVFDGTDLKDEASLNLTHTLFI